MRFSFYYGIDSNHALLYRCTATLYPSCMRTQPSESDELDESPSIAIAR